MISAKFLIYTTFFIAIVVITGCDKSKIYDTITPPAQAHFLSPGGTYYVTNSTTSVFKIPVGTTTKSNTSRVISVSISSPTSAASGTQYTLASSTVTIPAGKVIDSLPVMGIFAGYAGTRIDTLVFKIGSGDGLDSSSYMNTYRLVLKKYCSVVLPDFAGVYNKAFDIDDSDPTNPTGPYEIDITSGTISGTTGYILMDNFWDVGSQAIRLNLDWTSADNFKTTIPDQFLFVDSRYGNARVRSAGNGTFSSCDKTFTVKYEVYVSAGSFGTFVTTIAR